MRAVLRKAFTDPFPGMTTGGTMTQDELIRAVRLDLTAEQDAVSLYTAHAGATEDESVRKVFLSIADEERVHIGELQALIARLNPAEPGKLREGAKEVADQTAGTAKMIRVTLRKQGGAQRWVTIRGKKVAIGRTTSAFRQGPLSSASAEVVRYLGGKHLRAGEMSELYHRMRSEGWTAGELGEWLRETLIGTEIGKYPHLPEKVVQAMAVIRGGHPGATSDALATAVADWQMRRSKRTRGR